MKKSIFDRKMDDPRFRKVYEDVSKKLSLGEEISELRKRNHMTQSDLARKVHTSRTAIARYESGRYENFNISTLRRIARAFHRELNISFV
jgi:transcriptional regulator with XRE-family HTH domain